MMPEYDHRLRHERIVAAPVDRVYAAARSMTIRKLWRVRVLLWTREVFSRLGGLPLETFPVIAEREGQEVVRAICGRFWAVSGNILEIDPAEIPGFAQPGFGKAYWNFHVEAIGKGQTRLVSETRVCIYGEREKRKFKRYWTPVRPFAAWIRVTMMQAVEREALR